MARYERNFPAISEEEQKCLSEKKILIVGCGGLGGYIAEYSARIGIGAIHVVDGDVFEESNLNRQILSSPSVLGKKKAEVSAERLKMINPDIEITCSNVFFTEKNGRELLDGCDAVLDGLDSIDSRRTVARAASKYGVPYIFGAVNGWFGQAGVFLPGDERVNHLYPEGTNMKYKSVLSFLPPMCAAVETALCVKLLIGRPLKTGVIHYFDLSEEEYETINLQ